MMGGLVGGDLKAENNSNVSLGKGIVLSNLTGTGNSTTIMFGGAVDGAAQFSGNARFNWTGGVIGGNGPVPDHATPGLLGVGPVAGAPPDTLLGLVARDASIIEIIGDDLEARLLNPNLEGTFSQYELSGVLLDGTPIDGQLMYIQNGTGATFHLVPEPNIALASIAALAAALLRARRASRRA